MGPPPIVKIEARQFPVTAHFQKKTPAENEYLKETYKRVAKLHRSLPYGGILVFVTGKNEITLLSKWLQNTFPRYRSKEDSIVSKSSREETSIDFAKPSKRMKLDNFEQNA